MSMFSGTDIFQTWFQHMTSWGYLKDIRKSAELQKHVKIVFHMVQPEFLHLTNSEKSKIRNHKRNYIVNILNYWQKNVQN